MLGLRHLTVSTQTPTHSPPTRPSTDDKLKISPATSSGHYSADYSSPYPPGTDADRKEYDSNVLKLKSEIAQLKAKMFETEKSWAEVCCMINF